MNIFQQSPKLHTCLFINLWNLKVKLIETEVDRRLPRAEWVYLNDFQEDEIESAKAQRLVHLPLDRVSCLVWLVCKVHVEDGRKKILKGRLDSDYNKIYKKRSVYGFVCLFVCFQWDTIRFIFFLTAVPKAFFLS